MIHTEIQDGKGRLFMGYKLELGAWSAVFAVPNALVDRYIKEADGDQLKVMLWLLRHNGRPYAAEDLAAALGITPQRVDTALGFWMKSGLICSVDTPLDILQFGNFFKAF